MSRVTGALDRTRWELARADEATRTASGKLAAEKLVAVARLRWGEQRTDDAEALYRAALELDPACVDACPSRALGWGPIQELRDEFGDQAGIAPLPDPSITGPHLVIRPHRDAQGWDAGTGSIANPREI